MGFYPYAWASDLAFGYHPEGFIAPPEYAGQLRCLPQYNPMISPNASEVPFRISSFFRSGEHLLGGFSRSISQFRSLEGLHRGEPESDLGGKGFPRHWPRRNGMVLEENWSTACRGDPLRSIFISLSLEGFYSGFIYRGDFF
jgi:hypothetical protein